MTYDTGPAAGAQTQRRGVSGFMTSLPGVLTALAAVVTAVGGIYLGVHKNAGDTPAPQPAVVVNLQSPAAQPPPSADSGGTPRIDSASTATIESATGDDVSGDLVDACAGGDMSACGTILTDLRTGCADGVGLACDVLYEVSPAGSAIEQYAATCGDRLDSTDDAGDCENL